MFEKQNLHGKPRNYKNVTQVRSSEYGNIFWFFGDSSSCSQLVDATNHQTQTIAQTLTNCVDILNKFFKNRFFQNRFSKRFKILSRNRWSAGYKYRNSDMTIGEYVFRCTRQRLNKMFLFTHWTIITKSVGDFY